MNIFYWIGVWILICNRSRSVKPLRSKGFGVKSLILVIPSNPYPIIKSLHKSHPQPNKNKPNSQLHKNQNIILSVLSPLLPTWSNPCALHLLLHVITSQKKKNLSILTPSLPRLHPLHRTQRQHRERAYTNSLISSLTISSKPPSSDRALLSTSPRPP